MKKTTKLKCSCGAEFEMSEEDCSYIDSSNGKLDSKGRMFIYQVRGLIGTANVSTPTYLILFLNQMQVVIP